MTEAAPASQAPSAHCLQCGHARGTLPADRRCAECGAVPPLGDWPVLVGEPAHKGKPARRAAKQGGEGGAGFRWILYLSVALIVMGNMANGGWSILVGIVILVAGTVALLARHIRKRRAEKEPVERGQVRWLVTPAGIEVLWGFPGLATPWADMQVSVADADRGWTVVRFQHLPQAGWSAQEIAVPAATWPKAGLEATLDRLRAVPPSEGTRAWSGVGLARRDQVAFHCQRCRGLLAASECGRPCPCCGQPPEDPEMEAFVGFRGARGDRLRAFRWLLLAAPILLMLGLGVAALVLLPNLRRLGIFLAVGYGLVLFAVYRMIRSTACGRDAAWTIRSLMWSILAGRTKSEHAWVETVRVERGPSKAGRHSVEAHKVDAAGPLVIWFDSESEAERLLAAMRRYLANTRT